MGEMRSEYMVFARKSEGKRLLGRLRCRWENNIKMDLKETVWEVSTRFIRLTIGTHVNTVMNLQVLKRWGISCLAEQLVVSQQVLCSMELVSWLYNNIWKYECKLSAGKVCKQEVMTSFKVLSKHLPGGTEENHKKPQSG
jgi:hypothetical protein